MICAECNGQDHSFDTDYLCEECRAAKCCGGVPVFGVVPASDPRWFGGFVDDRGIRHDPLRHKDDCPSLRSSED
jgi:hypothetical protein